MTKKEEGSSIFDIAGKQRKPLRQKNNSVASAPSTPPSEPASEKVSAEDADKMIQRMHELKHDLETKLENTYQKSGISRAEVRNIVRGMDEEGKKRLKSERKALEDKLWLALGEEARERKERKDKEKLEKARKAKTGGGRRKWIQT